MDTPTVLVVDDDPDVRDALELVVGLAGFPVVALENGRKAVDYLRQMAHPCMLLLDLMMPVMDGWQVLDIIQREELIPLSHVLVLTASRDPQLPAGVKLLPKPMTVDAIVAAIRAASAPPTGAA